MGKNSNASNTDQICSNRSELYSVRLLLMTSVQLCICDPRKGHLRSNNDVMRSMCVFAYNFWLEWDRDLELVLKCSPCPGASNDIQHDLVRSPFDLDLRLKISWPFEVTIYIVRFVPTRQNRWYLYYSCIYIYIWKSYSRLNISLKNSFLLRWPLEAKPLTLGQIWWTLLMGNLILFRMPFSDLP